MGIISTVKTKHEQTQDGFGKKNLEMKTKFEIMLLLLSLLLSL